MNTITNLSLFCFYFVLLFCIYSKFSILFSFFVHIKTSFSVTKIAGKPNRLKDWVKLEPYLYIKLGICFEH